MAEFRLSVNSTRQYRVNTIRAMASSPLVRDSQSGSMYLWMSAPLLLLVYLFDCLRVYMLLSGYVYLSVCLSVCLSVYMSVCLSVVSHYALSVRRRAMHVKRLRCSLFALFSICTAAAAA